MVRISIMIIIFSVLLKGQVNTEILDSIISQSKKTNTDALIVYKDGKIIYKDYFGKPAAKIEAMSASKSVVSIAVGLLLENNFIKSIDEPVSSYYPEWRQGRKKDITIRHLLNHTSGIQNVTNAGIEIETAPDVIQLALCAELENEPGSLYKYNNKATNLLSGLVKKTSGLQLDQFLSKYLFDELGIKDFFWVKDDAGNPLGMSGLNIYPEDFLKIGEFILNKGKWNDRQILSESWINEMMTPFEAGSNYSLQWWLLYEKQVLVFDESVIESLKSSGDSDTYALLEKLIGSYETGFEGLRRHARAIFNDEELQRAGKVLMSINPNKLKIRNEGKISAYIAQGYLGQFLIIIPDKNIIVVKMISSESYNKIPDNSDFSEIRYLVQKL